MAMRKFSIVLLTLILVGSTFTGVANALEENRTLTTKPALENVRAYAAPAEIDGVAYAVDGGLLYQGSPLNWTEVATPASVVVGAVAMDEANQSLYIGAANEMAIYRSTDGGESWLRVPLSDQFVGGVTDIAVDGYQRLIYVGTDTAGLFRLRDVGSSMVVSGQLLLDEPVVEVAADSTGAGMAFVRTQWRLYQAQDFGLSWIEVENLKGIPTAVEIANTQPATVFVGTTDRGLLKSHDGLTWEAANQGLGLLPGTRLSVDALAVDPAQPDVLYVATSYLNGTNQVYAAPLGVSVSIDGANEWVSLHTDNAVAMAGLMPVSGATGAVYAVTTQSRSPMALGSAPQAEFEIAAAETVTSGGLTTTANGMLAWIVAALAGLALIFAVGADLRSRSRIADATSVGKLAPFGQ